MRDIINNPVNKKAYLAASTYSLIMGLSFLFGKIALEVSHPLDLLSYRFSVSFLVIVVVCLLKLVRVNYNLKRILKILPLTLFYPLLFFTFQTYGLQYTSSAEAGIIQSTMPVITLIMASYILKEETTMLQKVSIIISVLGVVYITVLKGSNLSFNNVKGLIMILLSVLCYSSYSVIVKGLTKDFSSIELSFIMITIGFISFNAVSITKHMINKSLGSFLLPLTNSSFVIAVIYLGVLSTLGTATLANYVLSKIEATKMVVFSNLGTVISIFAGLIVLNEQIFYYHIIGSILIIVGAIGTNFLDKSNLQFLKNKQNI